MGAMSNPLETIRDFAQRGQDAQKAVDEITGRHQPLQDVADHCKCGATVDLAQTVLWDRRARAIIGCPQCCDWRIRNNGVCATCPLPLGHKGSCP